MGHLELVSSEAHHPTPGLKRQVRDSVGSQLGEEAMPALPSDPSWTPASPCRQACLGDSHRGAPSGTQKGQDRVENRLEMGKGRNRSPEI